MNTAITSKSKAPRFGLNATILVALIGLLTLVALFVAAPYLGAPRASQAAGATSAQVDDRPLDQHDRHPVDPYKVSGAGTFIEERQERLRWADANNGAACLGLSDKIEQARCSGVK